MISDNQWSRMMCEKRNNEKIQFAFIWPVGVRFRWYGSFNPKGSPYMNTLSENQLSPIWGVLKLLSKPELARRR